MNHSGYAHEIRVDHEHINTYGDTLQVHNDKRHAMQSMMLYKDKTGKGCVT
jgi:hemerythrin superfamily protein